MSCSSCHASLPPQAKFCSQCGARADQASQAVLHAPDEPPSEARGDRGTRPLGDRRVATVLFTDVSGFTSMSEKLDPEEVTDIVNQFFKVLSEPIVRFGGTIDKYMGDAIMAIFGAPVAHEDDPERAVYAAWQMQVEANRFAASLRERTGIHLKVRIGINTGLVIATAVGSQERSDYTVMGDTVNLAQRMEQAATPGKVLVTEKTYRLALHAFDFKALAPITVKGKAEQVPVYELVGPRWDVEKQGGDLLVGREGELQQLQAALEKAFNGKAQLVHIIGEAGMGKSALVRVFVTSLKSWTTCRIIRGRSFSFDAMTSYAMIQNLLRRWFGIPAQASVLSILNTLRAKIYQSTFSDADKVVALLAYIFSVEVGHPEVDAMDPRQRRTEAFTALCDLILAEAANGPVLLSFDDLHWADEESLTWLESLLERLDGLPGESEILPVLMLVQYRPEFDRDLGAGLALESTPVPLCALPEARGLELIGRLLGEAQPPDTWPEALRQAGLGVLERCLGNPHYITETIRSLREQGHLLKLDGEWHVSAPPTEAGEVHLTDNLHGLMAARLDLLSLPAREVLQVASVVGRHFDLPLIEKVEHFTDLAGGLEELVSKGLIKARTEDPDAYSFTQDLIQQVAYQSLLVRFRKDVHVRVAETLRQRHEGHLEEVASTLARHYLQSEAQTAIQQGIRFLYLSGDWAKRCCSNQKALTLLARALETYDAAESSARPEDLGRGRILQTLAEVELGLGMRNQALEHLEEALFWVLEAMKRGLPGPVPWETRQAQLLRAMGELHLQDQALEVAMSAFHRALDCLSAGALAKDAAAVRERSSLRLRLGQALLLQGVAEPVFALCREILDAPEEAPLEDRAWAHGLRALALRLHGASSGEVEQARQWALGFLDDLALMEGDLAGRILRTLGDAYDLLACWSEAEFHRQKAIFLFRQLEDGREVADLQVRLARTLLCRGAVDEAAVALAEAEGLAREIGEGSCAIQAAVVSIELDLAREKPREGPEASQALNRALELVGGDRLQEGRIRRLLSALHLQAGELDAALAMAGRAVNLLKDPAGALLPGPKLELGKAYRQLHAVLAAMQRTDLATSALRAAREIFEGLGCERELTVPAAIASGVDLVG